MDYTKLEAALTASGWHFDAERELFRDTRGRRVNYRRILDLMPGLTLDDLAAYVNHKHEARLAKKQLGEQ